MVAVVMAVYITGSSFEATGSVSRVEWRAASDALRQLRLRPGHGPNERHHERRATAEERHQGDGDNEPPNSANSQPNPTTPRARTARPRMILRKTMVAGETRRSRKAYAGSVRSGRGRHHYWGYGQKNGSAFRRRAGRSGRAGLPSFNQPAPSATASTASASHPAKMKSVTPAWRNASAPAPGLPATKTQRAPAAFIIVTTCGPTSA